MLIWDKIWTIFILIVPWQRRKFGYGNIFYILVWGVIWATWIEPPSPAHSLLVALVSGPALFLGSSRQQRDAGIKQLSLSCPGFWPSPPKQSQVLPCQRHNQNNHGTLLWSQQTKVSSPNWESSGLTGMQGLGPKKIQTWVWLQMNTAVMSSCRCHRIRWSLPCWEISRKGSSSETDLFAL